MRWTVCWRPASRSTTSTTISPGRCPGTPSCARTWIGRFPIDYWGGLVGSLIIAATARLATGDFGVLARQAGLIAGFAALTLATNAAAPAYMRWHAHMRRPGSDERAIALPPESSNGSVGNGTTHARGGEPRGLD